MQGQSWRWPASCCGPRLPCTPFSWPGVSGVSGRAAWREDIYDDCLQELRWLYDRRSVEEARRDLAAWIAKWEGRYPRLVAWAEETIEETLTFYRLPRQHPMQPPAAGWCGRWRRTQSAQRMHQLR